MQERLELLVLEELHSPAALVRLAFDAQQACERSFDRRGAAKWKKVVAKNTKLSSKCPP